MHMIHSIFSRIHKNLVLNQLKLNLEKASQYNNWILINFCLSFFFRVGMSGTLWRKCIFPPAGSSEAKRGVNRFIIFHFGQIKRPNYNFWTIFPNILTYDLDKIQQFSNRVHPVNGSVWTNSTKHTFSSIHKFRALNPTIMFRVDH